MRIVTRNFIQDPFTNERTILVNNNEISKNVIDILSNVKSSKTMCFQNENIDIEEVINENTVKLKNDDADSSKVENNSPENSNIPDNLPKCQLNESIEPTTSDLSSTTMAECDSGEANLSELSDDNIPIEPTKDSIENSLAGLTFRELQAKAKEQGVSAKGTKTEVRTRILEKMLSSVE